MALSSDTTAPPRRGSRRPGGPGGEAAGQGEAELELPRSQAGPQPQRLLLTLLGDYWWRQQEPIPSAALVRLLLDFDVSEASARAAFGRLTRRGLLELTRDGRRTCYRLTERADRKLTSTLHRILTFGEHREWDGRWTIVLFSVPENRRELRHSLRTRLRWLGFAPLQDGTWVSPNPLQARAELALRELGIDSGVVLTVVEEMPQGRLLSAWDLQSVATDYQEFLRRYGPLAAPMRAGSVGSAQALRARTELMDEWSDFFYSDPDLPTQLLPAGWPQAAARALFIELYDGLGLLGAVRFRQLIGEVAPDLAALVRQYGTESLARYTTE